MKQNNRVAIDDLRRICDPSVFTFTDTSEVEPLDRVIGQKRAVKAIEFGLNMKSPGYNIFLTGLDGTGKTTIIKEVVKKITLDLPVPDDWCIVNNFNDPYRPKALQLPAGRAAAFAKLVDSHLKHLQFLLKQSYGDETFTQQLEGAKNKHKAEQSKRIQDVAALAETKSIRIQQTKTGFQALPFKGDAAMTPEEFDQLADDEKKAVNDNISMIQEMLKQALNEINKSAMALADEAEALKKEVAVDLVKEQITAMKKQYRDCSAVASFLDDVNTDIVENINSFLGDDTPKEKQQGMTAVSPLDNYRINVLVDRRSEARAPVIFEPNPTYTNLFGQIEKRVFMGGITTDFTKIQAGSLLRANGGFIILDMMSLLAGPHVWESLKRALLNRQVAIEDFPSESGRGISSLRPQPIPLDLKVILIGSYQLFEQLQNHDPKFNKIFKVKADFDHETDSNKENIQLYARFVAGVCKVQGLLPFTPDGVAAIIEFGEKTSANQSKLSLRFGTILDVLKESDYWARQEEAETITQDHVLRALNEHHFRHSLYEEKIHESYADNTLMIDVTGDVTGQVNGLAVYQIGETAFGRPSRITAETYMGKSGIINVEREADLSGKTHNKGVMIISGWMGRTFARDYPLCLSISIAFEQNYGGIDGDSASSTELYAILSSLSGVPIRQGLAVTGSVNQKGFIQAIGGVNEKIEGFFDVCCSKGFTGEQGVLIPKANVKNLMLRHDVIEAVKNNRFHIHQVATIAQGIEILTGLPAGSPGKGGVYPENTIFGKVQQQLKNYFEKSKIHKTRLIKQDS